MEILKPEQYAEYETFCKNHPNGEITQSVKWHSVKNNWSHEVLVCRDAEDKITGGMSVLVQRMPVLGTSMLYAPRGPVCDRYDREVMADLKRGVDALAKKHRAHLFKIDPDIAEGDEAFLSMMSGMGFKRFKGPEGFETIQARFNYRLYLGGRTEDEILMNLTQQTRRNVRIAQKHNVEVRVCGKEYLDDFVRIMRITGERDSFNVRSKSYFERMLDCLGENCRLYMAFYEDEPVAGAISTNYAGKTCYIYGASDNANRNVMPNYLVQWEMIKWAVETGCTVYDFQGVSGNTEDTENHLYGLYRFKKGFNGTLDELCGEFDYIYRPVAAFLFDKAVKLNEWLRTTKRRCSR